MKTINYIKYNEWVQDPETGHITTTHVVGSQIMGL